MRAIWEEGPATEQYGKIWKCAGGTPEVWRKACVLGRGGKWWISSKHKDHNDDLGPYESLDHAIQVAETMYELNALPAHWPLYEVAT